MSILICFICENYPCEKYDNIDEFDSFITRQHQKQDIEKSAHAVSLFQEIAKQNHIVLKLRKQKSLRKPN